MFIVTGSGRSGTSAVGRVLHESGISMGRHLIGPASFNATGFFEEQPVMEVNDAILERCGFGNEPGRLGRLFRRLRGNEAAAAQVVARRQIKREKVRAAAPRYRKRMEELIAGVPEPGGWKDPRFSWTLEGWLPYFPQKPRLIICLRPPEAVAGSAMDIYAARNDDLRQALMGQWVEQYERLLDVIHDWQLDATCVEYQRLMEDPAATVARLAEFVGLPLDPQYVEPSLQHHSAGVPDDLAALYERVRALAGAPKAVGS